MRFFDLFKRKPQKGKIQEQPLMAKLLFNHHETFELTLLVEHLKNEWNSTISNINGGNGKASFQLNGETVVLTTITQPIPFAEMQSNASIAYNWGNAEDDLKNHNLHVEVSIAPSTKSLIERSQIHNQVLASILSTTNCVGIYHLSQELIIPRKAFLEIAQKVKNQDLPSWD